MDVVNVVRFTIPEEDEQKMLAQRDTLLAAVRAHGPGLLRTVLTRVDGKTWMDVWHWASEKALTDVQKAQLPEAAASFAMVTVIDGTMGHVVAAS